MGNTSVGFNSFAIPKLEGRSRFLQWKVMYISSLQSLSAWKHVLGVAVPPLQDLAEKEYMFQERVEIFHSRIAQAQNIILVLCKAHIQ